jgi:hypothetical protein
LVGQLLGPALVARREIPDDGYADLPLVDYDISDDAPREMIQQALTIVGLTLVPALREFIVGELYRMRLVTRDTRELGDADMEAMATFYAEALEEAGYPADVVSSACRQRATFWPDLAQLMSRCDKLLHDRRVLQSALKRGPNMRRPTAEEIAERQQRQREREQRYAEAAAARAANPGPALNWKQRIVAEEVAKDARASARRVAEDLKNWTPIPLPTPFEPSASFAAAERALAQRQSEPPKPEDEQ